MLEINVIGKYDTLSPMDSEIIGKEIYDSLPYKLFYMMQGRFVAIHTPSGKYAIGKSSYKALQRIRKVAPKGNIYIRSIGCTSYLQP